MGDVGRASSGCGQIVLTIPGVDSDDVALPTGIFPYNQDLENRLLAWGPTIMEQDHSLRQQLLLELEDDADCYFQAGRVNNITDIVLSMLTVTASLSATVLSSTMLERWAIALVAGLPVAFTTLERLVGFRARSGWYFRHAAQVRALAIALKHDTAPDLQEYARKRGKLEVEMENEWDKVLGLGAKPSRQLRKAK